MKTVFIWPNTQKGDVLHALRETLELMERMGATVLLPAECAQLQLDMAGVRYAAQEDGVRACDFLVSLGGDGTILRIAGLAAKYQKPLIGVNLGHVGFMTELERQEIHKIEKIFAGKYSVDNRMMLELRIARKGNVILRCDALNDVTVTKINPFRVIRVAIRADGVPVTAFTGDGVIIATPTGTTAYSLAAGGPIIEPTAENIAVTPVCAHDLRAKSFVFAPEREISIAASGPENTNVCVSADGASGITLWPEDRVWVRRSALETSLLRVKGKSFYHILKHKLSNGGERL